MSLILKPLPYDYDALAPVMSAETLEFHHDKHHKAYADKASSLLEGSGLEGKSLEEIIVAANGDSAKLPLFNNAAQHWNHEFFWNSMKPSGGGAMPSELEKAVVDSFGSVDEFKAKFVEAGVGQFGSGWCWLVKNEQGSLEIMKTANADNPLCHGKTALIACDVWEHSYYIDYRNLRPKYIEAFLGSLVNWEFAAENFSK